MRLFIIPVLFYLLFLCFAIPAVNSPLTYDELNWPIRAESLAKTGQIKAFFGEEKALYEPPLYINIQASLYKLFGVSNFSSRLIGVSCVLFQLVIFLFFGKTLLSGLHDRWRFLFFSSLIFITNPAVIQGALLPFHDTTMLPVFLTLFALFFLRLERKRDFKSCMLLGIIFSISLWTALATPPVLILGMAIYYLFNRDWKGIACTLAVFIVGLGIFLVSWLAYSNVKALDFWGPMRYVFTIAFFAKQTHRTAASAFMGYSTVIVRVVLWAGIYTSLLWLAVLIKRILSFKERKILEPIDFLMICAVLLGIGYTFVGGTEFGFVRYYYPIFPALAIVSAYALKDLLDNISRKDLALCAGVSILVSAYLYFVVGDLIYMFNFSLREAIALNPSMVKGVLSGFVHKYILYLLPLAAVFLIVRAYKKGCGFISQAALGLAIMICAANISLSIIQAKADYSTRYCYGEKGTTELIKYLDENTKPGERVLATNDIIYYLRNKKVSYLPIDFWYDRDGVMNALQDPPVEFVVYSIGHNDVRQFREVFSDKKFITELKDKFLPGKIGTYTVWRRKPADA